MEGNPNEETTNMASDHQTLITSFMEITSSTQQEAQFFLESHNFDVDAAVSTFFESTTTSAAVPPPPVSATADDADFPSPQPSPSPSSPSASLSPSPSRSRSHSPPSGPRSLYNLRSRRPPSNNGRGSNTRSRNRTNGGVRTLADLNRNSAGNASGTDDDDNEDDDNNQYYTGGEKSGMVVEDPSKGNDVEAIFEQARRRAVQRPVDVHQPSSSSRSFSGTARLLSGEPVSSSPHEQAPEVVTHAITLWHNGFTVDDGPLRRFDDEENAPMLESIKNSECPKELEPVDKNTAVHVDLVRRDENYPEPKKQKTSFQGVGRTLGTDSSTSSEPSAASTAINSAPSPVIGLIVDDKLPSTSIQVRLADGTRMVSRFNYHHTIRDIHAFIDASRPARMGAYTLQIMGFPPQPLTDIDQTIEEAGLANSVVIQKF